MTNENLHINGWKAAEHFSGKSFYLKIELEKLKKENISLLKIIEELKAEVQRLQQVAQY